MQNADLARLVERFVADIETLIQQQALAAVGQAIRNLGGGAAPSVAERGRAAVPAKRGRPTAAAATPATKATTPATKATTAAATKAKTPSGKSFVRRSSDEVNATADRILEYVRKHPGQRAEQIKATLKIATNEWMLPIAKLVAAKHVTATGNKRATTYSVR